MFASTDTLLDAITHAPDLRDHGLTLVALATADALEAAAFGAVGLRSSRSFLRTHTRSTTAAASETDRVADLLVRHPDVRVALEAEHLPYAAAVALARVVTPPRRRLFDRDHALLVGHAQTLTQPAFERLVDHWGVLADQELDGSPDAGPTNRLFLQHRLDGGADLWGTLDAPTSDVVCRALDTFDTGPDPITSPEPPRPLSERRADALGDLAQHALSTADDTGRLARQPRVANLVVDMPTLAGRTAEDPDLHTIISTLDGRSVSTWAVERLLCDSRLAAIVTDATGAVIDATETTAEFTPTQRRLIAARDRGCVFPGCTAPPSWTDIHHLHHRASGGGRSLDNGVLLCRRHHRLVHQGWHLQRGPDGWHATRPDGRTIRARPPRARPRVARPSLD